MKRREARTDEHVQYKVIALKCDVPDHHFKRVTSSR